MDKSVETIYQNQRFRTNNGILYLNENTFFICRLPETVQIMLEASTNIPCPNMVMVDRKFVVRSQRISCDIRNFACRGENWQNKDRLQLFCNDAVFCYQCDEEVTIILLNLPSF